MPSRDFVQYRSRSETSHQFKRTPPASAIDRCIDQKRIYKRNQMTRRGVIVPAIANAYNDVGKRSRAIKASSMEKSEASSFLILPLPRFYRSLAAIKPGDSSPLLPPTTRTIQPTRLTTSWIPLGLRLGHLHRTPFEGITKSRD